MSIVQRNKKKSYSEFLSLCSSLMFVLRDIIFLFSKKMGPSDYPKKRSRYSSRFRGVHILTKAKGEKHKGLQCNGCMLCSIACPAECIDIQVCDSSVVKKFVIDPFKCTYCGLCEEVCPIDAIRLGPERQRAVSLSEKKLHDENYLSQRKSLHSEVFSIVPCPERNMRDL